MAERSIETGSSTRLTADAVATAVVVAWGLACLGAVAVALVFRLLRSLDGGPPTVRQR